MLQRPPRVGFVVTKLVTLTSSTALFHEYLPVLPAFQVLV